MKAFNYVADAQYAIYVHAAAAGEPVPEVNVQSNYFIDNFVGIYMASQDVGEVKAFIAGNGFYNVENLLPPFSGQNSNPEGLPQQEELSLNGIYVDNLSGFSSTKNTFDGLASGIVLNATNARIYRNTFTSIGLGAYPDYAFEGEAVAAQSTGRNSLDVEDCTFKSCYAGITAGQVALTARANTMNEVQYGISASLSNAGNITIGGDGDNRNTIHQSELGILVNHTGTGQAYIINNDVSTITGESNWGGGIALFFNTAPTLVRDNLLEANGATGGIALWYCQQAELLDNKVKLMDMADGRVGIGLNQASQCRLQNNTVDGSGLGGTENIGIDLQLSPGNIYCCNILDNTRVGVRVMAGCEARNDFRGTEFGNHGTGLLLEASGILGSQEHTKNRWTGSGGAEYLSPTQALFYRFTIDITPPNGSPEYLPDPVTPIDWFDIDEDDGIQDDCLTENCIPDDFDPESPDSKRIANGEIEAGEHTEVVQWELSRFLYRKLNGYAGADEDILDFIESSEDNSIGAFDALEENIQALLADEIENQLLVQAKLSLISAKQEEIGTLDSLYLLADEAGQDSLWLLRGHLLDAIATIALDAYTVNEALNEQRSLSAAGLMEQNSGIETAEHYEENQKSVNAVFLAYLKEGFSDMPVGDLNVLENIALQCPLEGGSAVLQARALLAVAAWQFQAYDDIACGGGEAQRPSIPVGVQPEIVEEFSIYPNPAKEQVMVDWSYSETPVINIQLLDIYGKVHQQIPVEPGTQNCVFSIPQLKAGLYMVRVQFQHRELVKKVIINP